MLIFAAFILNINWGKKRGDKLPIEINSLNKCLGRD